MNRCKWCNLRSPRYIEYHDHEWGVPNFDDKYLYEMLVLEMFQAGLSWECVLNKREGFREAFADFEINKVCGFDEVRVEELLKNEKIIRNRRKIETVINNSRIFRQIQSEFGSFWGYLEDFTGSEVLYESDKTTSELSDKISADLRKRGMKFVGSTTIYAYLQAIGVIYGHERGCFMYKNKPE